MPHQVWADESKEAFRSYDLKASLFTDITAVISLYVSAAWFGP